MCGILGVVTLRGEHPCEAAFDRALGLLDHRGPDDRGAHHGQAPGGVRISIGQTRLSILDLSPAGHQPMVSERTGTVMTYNGEAYNFRDVRSGLAGEGLAFHSECDTEVLLAAYDRRQDEFIQSFRGMFAIGLWDVARNRLLLVRDRLGIKPLYYYWDGRTLAFGSELTAISALPGLTLDICHEAMRQYLWRGFIPFPQSIFKQIRKLPAGCMLSLELSGGQPHVRQYWESLDYYASPRRFADEGEALDAIDATLREAVRLRLISDVPLGAFLSGGVDSSLVVAMMRAVHSGEVRTFSIGFDEAQWDEAPAARRIAQHLGTRHEEMYISRENLLDQVRTVSQHYDEPFADASAIPTLALAKLTRRHVTVALSGDGGDELFWGYDQYTARSHDAYPWAVRAPLAVRRALGALLRAARGTRLERWGYIVGFADFAEFFMRTDLWHPWADRGLHRHASSTNRMLEVGREVTSRLGEGDVAMLMGAMDLRSYLVDDILTKVDRATMAVALEARVPILDHHVVQLAASIPYTFKKAGGEKKHLLKAVLSRYVPRHLWERPKQGFGIPLVHYFRGPLRDWAADELFSGDHALGDWLDMAVVRRMYEDHVGGRRDAATLLWACLQLAGWDRRMRQIRTLASGRC
jgi:asparagine synthase (glutamine-hydrolysing)